jgi:hypothetical protein
VGDVGNALYGGGGDDYLNGGDVVMPDANTNDGGDGQDTCINPDTGTDGAVNCEE